MSCRKGPCCVYSLDTASVRARLLRWTQPQHVTAHRSAFVFQKLPGGLPRVDYVYKCGGGGGGVEKPGEWVIRAACQAMLNGARGGATCQRFPSSEKHLRDRPTAALPAGTHAPLTKLRAALQTLALIWIKFKRSASRPRLLSTRPASDVEYRRQRGGCGITAYNCRGAKRAAPLPSMLIITARAC